MEGCKMMHYDDWAEVVAFILLVIGFFLASGSGSAVISYLIIFLAGMVAGRIWYRIRSNLKTAWAVILIGFLIGFVLGSFYGNKRIIVVLYLFGIFLSYYLHKEKYIKSIEY